MTGTVRLQGLLVVFGAMLIGAAGGVLLERIRDSTPDRTAAANGRPFQRDSLGRGRRGPFPRAFEELQLTQAQRNSIDSIFRAWEPRTDSVMNEVLPRIQALRDTVRMEVDAILTQEQRELLGERMPQFGRDGRDGRNRSRSRGPDAPPRRPRPDN